MTTDQRRHSCGMPAAGCTAGHAPRLELVPTTLRSANAYIAEHHRPARGCISVVAVCEGGRRCGVAVVGRPLARMLQDGFTMLYRAAWRSVKALGYRRLVTYTLPREGGASLRAAGFTRVGEAGGRWHRPRCGRVRADWHPIQRKLQWEIVAEAGGERR